MSDKLALSDIAVIIEGIAILAPRSPDLTADPTAKASWSPSR